MDKGGNPSQDLNDPRLAEILTHPDEKAKEVEAALEVLHQKASANSAEMLQKASIPRPDKQRHFIAAFLFSFYFGWLGADRFYMGKYFTGLLKLLTLGGLGIWASIDRRLIMAGSMKDRWGNPLKDAAQYKKFARQTINYTWLFILLILIFAAVSTWLSWPYIQPLITKLTDYFKTYQDLMSASSGGTSSTGSGISTSGLNLNADTIKQIQSLIQSK